MKVFVETDRLILREIVEEDVQGFFELDSDPEVHRYLGNKPVKAIQECEKVIQFVRQQYEAFGIGRWAIVDKASDEFVGWSGLKYEQKIRPEKPYYDLGYRLKRKFWGKGIATESALESLKYGFETMELPEICAAALIENIASNKVLQKVGLTLTETFEFEGEVCNWYKIKKEDWKQ